MILQEVYCLQEIFEDFNKMLKEYSEQDKMWLGLLQKINKNGNSKGSNELK